MSGESEATSGTRTRRRTIDRRRIFERDEYRCQSCGREYEPGSGILEVAHRRPAREIDDPDDPDDLITLCPTCHRRFDLDELGETIASSLQRDFRERARARNHASTVEAFASDSIEITRMNILIASVFGTGLALLFRTEIVTDVSTLANYGIGFGGIAWVVSTMSALSAYYSCRTSGASSTAIEELLDRDVDDDLSEETTRIYYRNAKKIGAAIGLTLLCVLSLISGVALAIV